MTAGRHFDPSEQQICAQNGAAPAVDVLAGDTPVVEGLENPAERVLDLAAGTVSASVAAAGTTDPTASSDRF